MHNCHRSDVVVDVGGGGTDGNGAAGDGVGGGGDGHDRCHTIGQHNIGLLVVLCAAEEVGGGRAHSHPGASAVGGQHESVGERDSTTAFRARDDSAVYEQHEFDDAIIAGADGEDVDLRTSIQRQRQA